jgi:SanA protein
MKRLLRNKWVKNVIGVAFAMSVFLIVLVSVVTIHIQNFAKPYIVNTESKDKPTCYTAIVLGASVHRDGSLSTVLLDRVNSALELYKSGKVKRFLLSGDHGQTDYDEVNTMKNYLIKEGVDSADIFLDHAGFDTYSSMVRAKEVFKVDSLYIVTQQYHLYRAVYIARKIGLNAYGYVADKRNYTAIIKYTLREWLANVKSWIWVNTNHKPIYLGDPIPITGDSKASWDE